MRTQYQAFWQAILLAETPNLRTTPTGLLGDHHLHEYLNELGTFFVNSLFIAFKYKQVCPSVSSLLSISVGI